jgi:hypothetical protein
MAVSMTTTRSRAALLTARDHELLAALAWAPHTARQLLKLSITWPEPFRALRTIRERLQLLAAPGLVKAFRYASLFPGQPENYYLLARAGFEVVHGPDAVPPTRGQFAEVAISRHTHTRGLTDFLVHTAVSAHHAGLEMENLYRENSIRLSADEQSVYPDAGFLLTGYDRVPLQFFVEVDCGTERLRSPVSDRTWERKARVYDRVRDTGAHGRFRVLIVTVRAGRERLDHILQTAASVQRVPDRTLFCGITLPNYQSSELGVTRPLFTDHRGRRLALVDGPALPARESPRGLSLPLAP